MGTRIVPVAWTRHARRDVLDLVAFVARDSPTTAERLGRELGHKASSLARYPARGRVVPEAALLGIKGFRELLIGPYRLVYEIGAKEIAILAVIDGRRDFVELLAEIVACAAEPRY